MAKRRNGRMLPLAWPCMAVALVITGLSSPARAQSADSEWEVVVTPYFMGASMGGNMLMRGREVEVDLTAEDILSNLQFGAMAIVVARKGDWGVGGDALFMALGASGERVQVKVDFSQGAFAFYGLRRLGPAVDLTFGARVNYLDGQLEFFGPGETLIEGTETWVDPLVGLLLHTPGDRRVGFKLYTEIGGFGIGSKIEWQLFPTASIRLADWASLDLGWRWLDMDYATGEGIDRFEYDVLAQGPILGCSFKF